jgi:ketosteroid isomerase-like protein
VRPPGAQEQGERSGLPPAADASPGEAVDVVRGFLQDVRSGADVGRAPDHLAPTVEAHQGPPGSDADLVLRTPSDYAAHVEQMYAAFGPWTFEVLRLVEQEDGLVSAVWLQRGVVNARGPLHGRPVVELGRASYRVRDGRITEYWIDADSHVEAEPDPDRADRRDGGSTSTSTSTGPASG